MIYLLISFSSAIPAVAEVATLAEEVETAGGCASDTPWYRTWNVASFTDEWGTQTASASTMSRWGERIASWALPVKDGIASGAGGIQDWASRTWTDLGESVRNGRCRECGAPTLLGRDRCFHCMQKEKSDQFVNWIDRSGQSAREMLKGLRDPKLTAPVIERLVQARDYFRSRQKRDPAMEREGHRQMIEMLGRMRLANDGRTINEIARDALKTYAPALEGTDYIEDPARAISYFLILDAKGFLEKVKCIRLKDGRILTPIEAYQEYTQTDPAKAKDMLEIIEDIRQLSSPLESDENRIPAALDALARLLRLTTQ
ncbi:MAG TPA: hypothetical protein PLU72_15825 [Candidatus Ozemobacteraceae bacterium]|nr:hypothetical protein [Candidatus Ozemobacteraceae bacterium]